MKVLLRDSRTSVDVPFDGKDDLLIRKLVIHQVLPLDELNRCSNQRRKTPGSERLHKELRETFRPLIPNDPDYDITFDRWEYLLSLVGYDTRDDGVYFWAAVGRFGWRNRGIGREGASIVTALSKEHETLGSSWEPIASGLFENSERFSAAVKGFGEQSLANFSPY